MILYNATKDTIISNCVLKAYTMLLRMKGLLGKKNLAENCCMHIKPCSSIHSFFMKFPIDVLFLNRDMQVIYFMENLGRGRISPFVRKSHSVIELPAGRIRHAAIGLGDHLVLK